MSFYQNFARFRQHLFVIQTFSYRQSVRSMPFYGMRGWYWIFQMGLIAATVEVGVPRKVDRQQKQQPPETQRGPLKH
jgi:hypothetical protein